MDGAHVMLGLALAVALAGWANAELHYHEELRQKDRAIRTAREELFDFIRKGYLR